MIIYFSGTGNSYYAAKQLLNENEVLLNLKDLKETSINFKQERCLFVFPVYFYTLPSIVKTFIEKTSFENFTYMAAVITCGGGIMQAGNVLNKCLEKKGYRLNYVTSLIMPDNSMLFYQIDGLKTAMAKLEKTDEAIIKIKQDLTLQKNMQISNFTLISDLVSLGYKLCNKTKKFYALDSCISCGLCEKNCPEQVIQLENGKPVWVKGSCSKCSSCINRCPTKAIQYGKGTLKRNRYVNPKEGMIEK